MSKFKNVVFDFDSTLTTIEGLDFLAEKKGVSEKVQEITLMGMNGEISFDQSLLMRLEILKPTKKDFEMICKKYKKTLTLGAKKLLTQLKNNKTEIHLVTGGPRPAIEEIAKKLGIKKENIWACCFNFDPQGNSILDTDCVMSKNDGKQQIVKKIAKTGKTVMIGDGMTDFKAGLHADLFIGFGGIVKRQPVKDKAKIYLEDPNLINLLKYLDA